MDHRLPDQPLGGIVIPICMDDLHRHHSLLWLQYATKPSDYDGMVLPCRSERCNFLLQRIAFFRSFIFCGSALKSLSFIPILLKLFSIFY